MGTPQEPYYCSGTLCTPSLESEGNGFCYMDVDTCKANSGYNLPKKYCASKCCYPTGIDYQKPTPNDVCTASRHTCLHASKHRHAGRFHPVLGQTL